MRIGEGDGGVCGMGVGGGGGVAGRVELLRNRLIDWEAAINKKIYIRNGWDSSGDGCNLLTEKEAGGMAALLRVK